MSDERSGKADGESKPSHFIREIVREDLASGKTGGRVQTRFPPEPNGYLHIGHAKSICLNFGVAAEFGGQCNLRFDDTNPDAEDVEYVESIKEDVRWLGFDWEDRIFFASDYFDQLYEWAVKLIRKGLAYVDDLTLDEIRELRGDYYREGKPSPYRDRPVAENLDLFARMKAGEFPDGAKVLRAKIEVNHANMNMRDPIMYRIRHAHHHRTGDTWCIYPMYDWAHGQSDAIEQITHSICTLEFQDHRPLYEWYLAAIDEFDCPPRQFEFARLNLTYTVLSKRRLLQLVTEKHVSGWDDPRMPTLSGMRRRGYTPESIRDLADRIGVAKADSTVDMALVEHCIREDLNRNAPRVMAVLDPLKVVIENFPADRVEMLDAPYLPEDFSMGSRPVPLTRELYVERDDFREDAPKKWHRLAPGAEVRLRYACLLTCKEAIKDPSTGEVVELRCEWDPESLGGASPDGRKVRGTLHWVSASRAVDATVRLYDRLFTRENPMDASDGSTFKDHINPDSLSVVTGAKVEPALADAAPGSRFQFERLGYFCVDTKDSAPGALVFNRTVTLRDSWAKIEKAQGGGEKPAPKKAPAKKNAKAAAPEAVTIDDFAKLDLRVGLVREASLVESADKLLRLMVDVGEETPRQIFSGIRADYPDPQSLVGKRVMTIVNLKPRKMKFGVSEGMVLAGGTDKTGFAVATFDGDLPPGAKVS